MGNLILIIFVIAALYGLFAVLRNKGAGTVLGGMVLAGFIGYLIQSADGNRLGSLLSPSTTPSQPRIPASSEFVSENTPMRQAPYVESDRTSQPRSAHDFGSATQPLTPRPPTVSAANAADAEVHSEMQIVVEGSWGAVSADAVESAVRSALRERGWEGPQTGGRTVLRIRGSAESRDLTLGQIPTASVDMNWSLTSPSGAVLADGGLANVQGTGLDDTAAHHAALRRAVSQLVSGLTNNP